VLKQPGVKKAEIADRKLEEAFKAKGKMTKEEAQNILARNPPPKLQERVLEDISDTQRQEIIDDNMMRYGYDLYDDVPRERMRQWENEIEGDAVKYGDYQTPGGENYREILLKLPQESEKIAKADKKLKLFETAYERDPTQQNYAQMKMAELELDVAKKTSTNYKSQHWDDPNVLAHIRVQDRKGANGEKILHVEEIQSDWHQAGRKKGYGPQLEEQYRAYYTTPDGQQVDIGFGKTPEEVERMTQVAGWNKMPVKIETEKTVRQIGEGVPDAPFKKNWHELAMKRLLNYAADNGYDSIAITPGAEQAKRFNLRNRVDELLYKQNEDGTYQLSAQRNGRGDLLGERVPVEKLEDYVGKEVAQRIVDNAGTERNLGGSGSVSQPKDVWGSLSGEGLEVGGAGMMGFYDKMLPDYLNNYGKQYGARVEQIPFDMGGYKVNRDSNTLPYRLESATSPDIISRFATPEEAWAEAEKLGSLPLHNFKITPEMRESIKQKGLPLYQQIGIPTAGAGAASQMLEPQEEPQYGTGGAIAKMALKAAPEPRSPAIMRSSALTNVKSAVRQDKGQYGARRLDRAADEIPNLEKMFKQDALIEAFTGDNAKALMTMNPADFEKYAVQLKSRNKRPTNPSLEDRIRSGEIDKHDLPTDEYIKFLRTLPYGFDDVPFLQIDKQEYGLPLVPSISGHEGRHRSRALAESGENKSLVRLFPDPELREPLPRRSQEEYIEALKKELEMTGKIVTPEDYGSDKRPPIILPDIYAKGGSVKPQVKKSGSGTVKMTNNRDAMFMELSNKKLKRK
jgi:hypothetical protein